MQSRIIVPYFPLTQSLYILMKADELTGPELLELYDSMPLMAQPDNPYKKLGKTKREIWWVK